MVRTRIVHNRQVRRFSPQNKSTAKRTVDDVEGGRGSKKVIHPFGKYVDCLIHSISCKHSGIDVATYDYEGELDE